MLIGVDWCLLILIDVGWCWLCTLFLNTLTDVTSHLVFRGGSKNNDMIVFFSLLMGVVSSHYNLFGLWDRIPRAYQISIRGEAVRADHMLGFKAFLYKAYKKSCEEELNNFRPCGPNWTKTIPQNLHFGETILPNIIFLSPDLKCDTSKWKYSFIPIFHIWGLMTNIWYCVESSRRGGDFVVLIVPFGPRKL